MRNIRNKNRIIGVNNIRDSNTSEEGVVHLPVVVVVVLVIGLREENVKI